MSSLYCSYSSRDKAGCLFNVDCNNAQKNNIVQYPCPAEFDNYEILGCSQNNNSRSCPVLLCNYEKQANENSKIFSRNFPLNKTPVIPTYRGEYKVCNKYINKNDIPKKYKNNTNTINAIDGTETNEFYPGKAPASIYFQNVDIESNLYRLDNNDSKCPSKRYQPPPCTDKIITNNPKLLSNPTCQNTRFYDFSNEDKLADYEHKCGDITKEVNALNNRQFICEEQNTPYKTTSLLKYNYIRKTGIPCTTGCLPKNEAYINIRQPVPYSMKSDMLTPPVLQVGPERVNHKLENIWNNVTKRQYINK